MINECVFLEPQLHVFVPVTHRYTHTHIHVFTPTLMILGCVQRLFPDVACIQPAPSASCSGRWEFPPPVHSCLREHFLSWTHQPHSNLGSAFRHMPQLSRRALHLYKWAARDRERQGFQCDIYVEFSNCICIHWLFIQRLKMSQKKHSAGSKISMIIKGVKMEIKGAST